MKKLSIIPAELPHKKSRTSMYQDALNQFAGLDVESARIEAEDMYASTLVGSINAVIRNSEDYNGFKAIMREGIPYLVKVSALED